MITSLEKIGFVNPYAFRVGPCSQCKESLMTYYIPEHKEWFCESCFYRNPENSEFISLISSLSPENTMTAQPTMQELLVELQALRNQVADQNKTGAQLKASSTDNAFVGASGNLTIKCREVNPRGWGMPTKNQQGQGYLRCGDFPMGYTLQSGKLVLHQEIALSPLAEQTFRERYINQNIVAAIKKAEGQAPPAPGTSTSTAPTPPAPVPHTATPVAPSGYTKTKARAEATGLIGVLAKDLPEAIKIVEETRHIKYLELPE